MNFVLTISHLALQVLIFLIFMEIFVIKRNNTGIFPPDFVLFLIYNVICMTVFKNPREAKSDGAQGGSSYSDK